MPRRTRYSPEVRERAVRMGLDHESDYASQWAAIRSRVDRSRPKAKALLIKLRAARGTDRAERPTRKRCRSWNRSVAEREGRARRTEARSGRRR